MAEKILVVEDEPHIAELICYNLGNEGYQTRVAMDGGEALDLVKRDRPDLVLLDLMLPTLSGWEVCKRLRQMGQIPIIILTAKGEEMDRVLGLELGADDYVTKPFSPRELVARVRAVLRRVKEEPQDGLLRVGDLEIDPAKYELRDRGVGVELTLKEFELLLTLVRARGQVLTRESLLTTVWGYEYFGDTRTVDVHVRRLRKKLGDSAGEPRYIQTVHGVGYRLRGDGL